ncbi:hypothetical protein [Micromonospora sp. NPDC047074]|uniref:hypothetical protein n=1 Tax=Micromonospora sp. NPDC047074 TaxID=3154339 RepID=UPI0033F2EC31
MQTRTGHARRSAGELEADLARHREVVVSFWVGIERTMAAYNQWLVSKGEPALSNEQMFQEAQIPASTGHRWLQNKDAMPAARSTGHLNKLMEFLRLHDKKEWQIRRIQADRAFEEMKNLQAQLQVRRRNANDEPAPPIQRRPDDETAAIDDPRQAQADVPPVAVIEKGDGAVRVEHNDEVKPPDAGGPVDSSGQPQKWPHTRVVVTAVLASVVLVGGVVVFSVVAPFGSPSDGASPSTSPQAGKIVRTWSSVRQDHLGTFSYDSPFANAKKVSGYPEGTPIVVTCQEPNGRSVTDRSLGLTSQAFYKTPGGEWLSSIYVQLDPVNGSTMPLPGC